MKEKYKLLLKRAEKTKNLKEKIELLESAMDLAHNNENYLLSYEAAMELMSAFHENGDYDKFAPIFYYCLDLYDANDDIFYPEAIYWKYKQYIEVIDKTPFIELESIEKLYDDLAERLKKLNYSLRPIHQYRAKMLIRNGKFELARKEFELFQQAAIDDMADCDACEANASIDFLLENDHNQAEEIINRIFSGELTCDCIPHLTYSKVIQKLKTSGDNKRALELHEKGYPLVKQSKAYLAEISIHLDLLTEVDIQKAVSLFNENLSTAEESCDYYGKFKFYSSALKMKKRAKEQNVLVYQFPKDIEEVTWEIAEEFDNRNENDVFTNQLKNSNL